jgi:hypothetical protein
MYEDNRVISLSDDKPFGMRLNSVISKRSEYRAYQNLKQHS